MTKYIDGKICPYCDNPTEYVDSQVIYGRSYGMIYICKPCNAWVGTHKSNRTVALGRLANSELREAKKEAHEYFDRLWKLGHLSRHQAYEALSSHLNIEPKYCHIGMFDVDMCKRVVEVSKMLLNDFRRLDLDFGVEPLTPHYG